jgi:S-adenosyl-L-methionine hydrolase (adenosine-forming)
VRNRRIITFTTDFGLSDHYVGTMKGVVLGVYPAATLVDICHGVPVFSILDGALTIAQAYTYFPRGTIHVIVVDPGVGGTRRPIIADIGSHVFVAPDNGVLSFVFEREPAASVVHVRNDRYFLHPVSNTFHGRDIFAPVAAHIASGVSLDSFGPQITDFVRLAIPVPHTSERGSVTGSVLKIDNFGNIITNITPDCLTRALGAGTSFTVKVGETTIPHFRLTYAGAAPGELFAIFGSMGYLEIALNQGSAAGQLGVQSGSVVEINSK